MRNKEYFKFLSIQPISHMIFLFDGALQNKLFFDIPLPFEEHIPFFIIILN